MTTELELCPISHEPLPAQTLAEAHNAPPRVLQLLEERYPDWQRKRGASPAIVQRALLEVLLEAGDEAMHESIQAVWPLDAEAAFGALPTPLRLHADPRYTGKGITIAFVDSGFYPHPDLVQPRNRIRAWVDASTSKMEILRFKRRDTPAWPGWDAGVPSQWHGMMTSVSAAGNGHLSHGLYRGLAPDADVVLIQAYNPHSGIGNAAITRALHWVRWHADEFGIRVVNLSLGGDMTTPLRGNPVDEAIADLMAAGIVVVAAAGNDGVRNLVPPATAPHAITVGGLDDKNTYDDSDDELWHSNYGESSLGGFKPELVAPSLWVVAPVLPNTQVAERARDLFAKRAAATQNNSTDQAVEAELAGMKLVTPHYQHVDGTSFAAPLTSSVVACMLQANPALAPQVVRDILIKTAQKIPNVEEDRQGAGALAAGRAVLEALCENYDHLTPEDFESPFVMPEGVRFRFHDHDASSLLVRGSWDNWSGDVVADKIDAGLWEAKLIGVQPGRYEYKFLADGWRWLDDPANPEKVHDGHGGFNSILRV